MNNSKWLSAGVSGVASVIGLAILFATAQAGAATELNSQQRAQQQSQQQIQQQTERRAGPIPNQSSQPSQPRQLNQSGGAEQKQMYQKQHQYKYEKNLQKFDNGNRGMGAPGSGNNGNRSPQGIGRSGGGNR